MFTCTAASLKVPQTNSVHVRTPGGALRAVPGSCSRQPPSTSVLSLRSVWGDVSFNSIGVSFYLF